MYIIIYIIQCTLDLTCWFIDLLKYLIEKTNSQTDKKSQWYHTFKNRGSTILYIGVRMCGVLVPHENPF
jgi:hypothetical protein